MHGGEFLEHVQRRAGLDAVEGARAVTYAGLSTLGERLPAREAGDAASELTDPLDGWLANAVADSDASYDRDEFVARIREREAEDGRVDDADAERHAKAALSTHGDAISDGELSKVRDALPDDFDDLFDPPEISGSSGGA